MNLVNQAQTALAKVLQAGDVAIDATVGNGHDTLFLARAVGEAGRVYGFDIQQAALDKAWQRLDEVGMAEWVSLYHAGHETMALHLPEQWRGRVKVVMFNLGYLPGGDKSRTTGSATTLAALQQSLEWLAPDGLLSVIVYTGHPGGMAEALAVREWIMSLPTQYRSALMRPPQTRQSPPEWWLIGC